jgi:aspartate/methionine/tyrosine aminotransferase
MEVMERAFAIERAGGKVLHLEIGEPDFPPPPEAVEACAAALRAGETRYTDSRGLSSCARRSPPTSRAASRCRSIPSACS